MKRILTVVFLLGCVVSSWAQGLQSPDQFLRYKLGDRFTPHYRIVEYFKHVSQTSPNMVKLEQYGETYEGRALYLAYVSSPENISKLENIRLNNLRLANSAKDRMAPQEDGTVIVWLSYNVHGNEPSSSEAAMKTLHALADPNNTRTKEWLKNTVVIIDPCLNPDGRDR
ncbi:MAG TPA: M14 family zinc carboxypeptidase, partial [Chitinophagaceae bacterium]